MTWEDTGRTNTNYFIRPRNVPVFSDLKYYVKQM